MDLNIPITIGNVQLNKKFESTTMAKAKHLEGD